MLTDRVLHSCRPSPLQSSRLDVLGNQRVHQEQVNFAVQTANSATGCIAQCFPNVKHAHKALS